MKLLYWLIGGIAAAGAAAYNAHRKNQVKRAQDVVISLEDDDLVDTTQDDGEDEIPDVPVTETEALVTACCREMDVVTLGNGTRVTFLLADETEKTFRIPGGNGQYLSAGDHGVLQYQAGTFISFEKDNGEVVGALFHLTPEDAQEENET